MDCNSCLEGGQREFLRVCPSCFVSQHNKILAQSQGLNTPETNPRGPWKDTFLGMPIESPGILWPLLALAGFAEVSVALIPKLPLGVMGMTHMIRERSELCILWTCQHTLPVQSSNKIWDFLIKILFKISIFLLLKNLFAESKDFHANSFDSKIFTLVFKTHFSSSFPQFLGGD